MGLANDSEAVGADDGNSEFDSEPEQELPEEESSPEDELGMYISSLCG